MKWKNGVGEGEGEEEEEGKGRGVLSTTARW